MASVPEGKPERLNIRVSQREKEVLARAAELMNTSVSQFVLQHACAEAQSLLAEQNRFRLTEAQWKDFCTALDAPAKDLPSLRRLFTDPGAFDDGA